MNNFDSIVLGKGPLGIFTSYKLVKSGKKVLNIDSGQGLKLLQDKIRLKSNINWLDLSQKPSLNKKASDYMWLGASMGWNEKYFKKSQFNFQSLPLDIIDIKSSYDEVAEILYLTNFDFVKNVPNNFKTPFNVEEFEYIFAKVTNNLYLKNLKSFLNDNDKYQFEDNLIAEKISTLNNDVIVELKSYPNLTQKKVQSNNLYICLGSVENTRILLNSENSLNLNSKLLGASLSDHISFPFAKIKVKNIDDIRKLFESRKDSETSKLWPRISFINSEIQSFCYIDKFYARKSNQKYFQSLLKYKGSAHLNLFIEKQINDKTYMELDNNKMLLVNFIVTKKEFENMTQIASKYIEFFRNSLQQEIKVKKLNLDYDKFNKLKTTNHPSGTTKMANNELEGVVDKYSRLWNHKNIFVYGSSVFPSSSNIHPTFMSMSLANYSLDNT